MISKTTGLQCECEFRSDVKLTSENQEHITTRPVNKSQAAAACMQKFCEFRSGTPINSNNYTPNIYATRKRHKHQKTNK
jgi:hypothetical protein